MRIYKKTKLWQCILVVAICLALAGCSKPDAPPEALQDVLLYDYMTMHHEEAPKEFTHPAYPNVVFRQEGPKFYIVDGEEEITFDTWGMGLENLFLSDLNGDGKPELCTTVSSGSGMIWYHVGVYDHTNRMSYIMRPKEGLHCIFYMEDGQLRLSQSTYDGDRVVSGKLTLEDGELRFTEDKVHRTPEIDAIKEDDVFLAVHRWYARNPEESEIRYRIELRATGFEIRDPATWDSVGGSGVVWQWQELPWTEEEWLQICGFGSPLRENYSSLAYQKLSEQYCILKVDAAMWLVELANGKVESIYQLGDTMHDGMPCWNVWQQRQGHPVPIHIQLPYTQLQVSCAQGCLADPEGTDARLQQITYEKGEPVIWKFIDAEGVYVKADEITITVINGTETVDTFTIQAKTHVGYVFSVDSPTVQVVQASNGDGIAVIEKP